MILIVFLATTVVRLAPDSFPQLPKPIVSSLKARGCLIPQVFGDNAAHNVIRGQFARRGQYDWAILCSREGASAILIFWGGSTKRVSEIAKARDENFLQVIDGDGRIGFSRAISVVDRDFILDHYKEYGGVKPPRISHHGIDDRFVEKGSSVHYLHRGKWLRLQGAD